MKLTGLFVTLGMAIVLAIACVPGVVLADDKPCLEADNMGTKLVRGVANIATGWLEFPKGIMQNGDVEQAFEKSMSRTGGGITDVATLPVKTDKTNQKDGDYKEDYFTL